MISRLLGMFCTIFIFYIQIFIVYRRLNTYTCVAMVVRVLTRLIFLEVYVFEIIVFRSSCNLFVTHVHVYCCVFLLHSILKSNIHPNSI